MLNEYVVKNGYLKDRDDDDDVKELSDIGLETDFL